MNSFIKNIILILSIIVFASCSSINPTKHQIIREAAMTEGMVITVNTKKYGEVIIKAGKGTERNYTWDGETFKTTLKPRVKRWHGKLGLYQPQSKPPHEDVVHTVIQECQIDVSSVADLTNMLQGNKNIEKIYYEHYEWVYRDDGLYVRFGKQSSDGETFIHIDVFQILINGEKPIKLPGSQNHKIKVQ